MISMNENQNQYQFPPFSIQNDTTSSLQCAILLNPQQNYLSTQLQRQEPFNNLLSIGGSSRHYVQDQTNEHDSVKWMSSKLRLMKKMLGSDKTLVKKQRKTHDQLQLNEASSTSNNSPADIIRVCSNCNTTKTPLWRGGPQGPKSLCNACGIRQMKARRAMRLAAERSNVDRTVPFKKRFKVNVTSSSSLQKGMRSDENTISLSNKSALRQAFPQEENDAAILLMALSCGLIHG